MILPEHIAFVLYKPAVEENIGAAARAIKTMGFSDLRLVEPADHLSTKSKMLAHGANEILEKASLFKEYRDAVADRDFIFCTTAKLRSAKVDYLDLPEISGFLEQKANAIERPAIVFGTEESGLPNSIILEANLGLTIPMATTFPSLNLSQAVMVVAYELSRLYLDSNTPEIRANDQASWSQLENRIERIMEITGIEKGTPLYHRIMERISYLNATDINLMHSVTSRLTDRMES